MSGGMVATGPELIPSVVSAIEENQPIPQASGSPAGRISALDFTKGALVLVMVLYHWLNYFVGPEGFFYRYLSFLPPSFICITGFLISRVYLSKYRIADAKLPRRLAIRGLKILGIFVVLNVMIRLVMPGSNHGKTFFEILSPASLWSIYVSGNMRGGRVVAFYVLVPISYLLLLSAGVLIARRHYKHAFHLTTVLGLLGILILNELGQKSQNLDLLFIGLLGISIGYIPIEKLNNFLKWPYVVVLAYLLYVAAITVWNVLYPLQVAGVLLTLMLIYLVGTASGETNRIPRVLILLGKYSLLGYIAQIAILQLLRRSLGGELAAWTLVLSFLAAVALTVISVEAVDRARVRAPIVNRLYGAVFA
jgi:peptidoglycan/LPS O-acetylase OafA/YrhL